MHNQKEQRRQLPKVLVIVGPTAVGKTALSIELAKKFNGEIISGDSMQVYRTLDIGTAKITPAEMAGIPHYLLDIRDITEGYSVADFQQEARQAIAMITEKGKLPIVVGGTGLYIQALLYDFKLGNDGAFTEEQQAQATQLETACAPLTNEQLWEKLAAADPLASAKIHFNNRRKVQRALEVVLITGHSIMEPKETPKPLYDYFLIGLTTERTQLYERINQRVDLMCEVGLLAEAKRVGQFPETQAAQGIGYKEFRPYFQQAVTLTEAVEQVKQNSRRYAKRQLTWFRNRMNPHWLDLVQHPEEKETIQSEIRRWKEVPNDE